MYYIWERSDGHINASAGAMPQGWQTKSGDTISFKLIVSMKDWDQVKIEKAIKDWKATK